MSSEHNPGRVERVVKRLAKLIPTADRLVQRLRVIEYLNATSYSGLAGGAWAAYFIQKGEYLTAAPGIILPLLVKSLTGIRYDLERRETMFQIDDLNYENTRLQRKIQELEPRNKEEKPS